MIQRGLDSCSQCDHYVCDKLKERLVVYEEVRSRIGTDIPSDDYRFFIKPYENKLRLEKLRSASRK